MIEPSIVSVTPKHSKIYYSVEKKEGDINQNFGVLADEIQEKRLAMP